MKLRCNKIVACGVYCCRWNRAGDCVQQVIALDNGGQCTLFSRDPEKSTETLPNIDFE